ncbi:FG-GAP-like repeat-containing protein [Streptomyces sp. NPDC102406]|uniref:FG-GAP-like repeat-containing protein n=1 Tax=Streptomyces sp. NPDC102406 TaxID=3366171 RepID=UPI003825CEA7
MHQRFRTALATGAVVALTGGLLVGAAGAGSAASPKVESDFNGDGYRDVVVSAPGARVANLPRPGTVSVLYGSANGASAAHHQTLDQNTPGIPGAAEAGDYFGTATAAGDFDSDGYADLAIGVTKEDVDGDTDNGLVQIVWGSPSGLTGGADVVDPAPTQHDRYGQSLAAGDFDGDGRTDLAVGTSSGTLHVFSKGISRKGKPGARAALTLPLYSNTHAGILNLVAGSVNKDGRADLLVTGQSRNVSGGKHHEVNYYLPGASGGPKASAAKLMPSGSNSAIGDIDGDGYGDIATGTWWATAGPDKLPGGKVVVTYGGKSGPSTRTQTITQASGAIPGDPEAWEKFGADVALGDVDGDGRMELAVGTPDENLRVAPGGSGVIYGAGTVTVLRGSASGADTTNAVQWLWQGTAGVPDSGWRSGRFGGEVHLADLDKDGKADLLSGARGDNNSDGSLTTLPSDGTAIGTAGAQYIGPKDLGMDWVGIPQLGTAVNGSRPVDTVY